MRRRPAPCTLLRNSWILHRKSRIFKALWSMFNFLNKKSVSAKSILFLMFDVFLDFLFKNFLKTFDFLLGKQPFLAAL